MGVIVFVPVGVAVSVGRGVSVGVGVSVSIGIGVSVEVGVSVAVEVGVYVDVGAHIGVWSLLVAALGGQVWCYEPIPENLQLIIRNQIQKSLQIMVYWRLTQIHLMDTPE